MLKQIKNECQSRMRPLDPSANISPAALTAGIMAIYALSGATYALLPGQTHTSFAVAAALAACLVSLTVIDLRSYRLPDALTLPLLLAGLALAGLQSPDSLLWHTAAAAVAGLTLYATRSLYRAWRGCDGLGLGDVKLFAAAGAWIGLDGLASSLLVACVAALAVAVLLKLADPAVNSKSILPFGPFLAIGFWIVWLYGPLA